MVDNGKTRGGKAASRHMEDPAGCVRGVVRSAWKSFSYDYYDSLQRLRQDASDCAAAFLLSCLFCFACAVTLTVIEGGHQEELRTTKESDQQDVLDKIHLKESSAVEELWQEAQTVSEEEWKVLALQKLREVNEAVAVLRGCDATEALDPSDWGVLNSFVYMLTVTTSIGYGHIAPSTNAGRALTIVYAILGIPIFLILMADFGKLFTRLLKAMFVFVKRLYRTATCKRIRKTPQVQAMKPVQIVPPTPPLAMPESTSDFEKQLEAEVQARLTSRQTPSCVKKGAEEGEGGEEEEEEPRFCCFSAFWKRVKGWCPLICGQKEEEPENEDDVVDDNFNLPISLALFILLVYIMLGCLIYTMWEQWTYFEAFYFIFISMTTIGFGDYVPQHPAFMMMTTVYLVFGLALTAMCINIIQEKLTDTFRQASEKLKDSFRHIMATNSMGEDPGVQEGKEVEVAPVHGFAENAKDTITIKKET